MKNKRLSIISKYTSYFLIALISSSGLIALGMHLGSNKDELFLFFKGIKNLVVSYKPGMTNGKYDVYGRLIEYPGKKEVDCPIQNKNTGVLLVIGQSNSANQAEKKIKSQFDKQVVNYFDGKCYIASSPLLGSTGEQGEFITLLAYNLLKNKIYKSIVIISSGIDGTVISQWQEFGYLNDMLLKTLNPIKNKYQITDVIWHQGESDFVSLTTSKVYEKSFKTLQNSLLEFGPKAPIFIAIATRCGNNPLYSEENPVALAQKKLVDNKRIFLGVNSDSLLQINDRRKSDNCHLSESGQIKISNSYSEAISSFHNLN